MEYGLQLYSVRDITQKGLESAMQKVADLGYSFVEFAGFFGNSAPEVGRMLRETGLRISGTHTGWEELTPARITDTILYHKIISPCRIAYKHSVCFIIATGFLIIFGSDFYIAASYSPRIFRSVISGFTADNAWVYLS